MTNILEAISKKIKESPFDKLLCKSQQIVEIFFVYNIILTQRGEERLAAIRGIPIIGITLT
jgi:hypothetical protein